MVHPKILVVSEIFWPEGGGAELATYLILKILRKAKYKISVVTGTRNPKSINGVKYYYTSLLSNFNRLKRWLYIYLLSKKSWFIKLMSKHDIVYIPLFAYPLIPIAKKMKKKVVVHIHNYVPIRYYGVKYYFEKDTISTLEEIKISLFHEAFINKNILRTLAFPISYIVYKFSKNWLIDADNIICVSRRQAEIIKKQAPYLSRKIKVIYNPLPKIPKIMKKPTGTPTLLYTGGDSYIKGFPVLLKTLILSHNKRYKFKVLMVNKCGDKCINRILKLRSILNVDIEVLGKIPYYQYLKLHEKTWSIIFPSVCEEPLPYTIVEAALTGTIPIAPKIGGIYEILERTIAEKFLFTTLNTDEIMSKIEEVLSMNKSEILDIGRELRKDILTRYKHPKNKLIDVFGG